jgi:hypothetical protein
VLSTTVIRSKPWKFLSFCFRPARNAFTGVSVSVPAAAAATGPSVENWCSRSSVVVVVVVEAVPAPGVVVVVVVVVAALPSDGVTTTVVVVVVVGDPPAVTVTTTVVTVDETSSRYMGTFEFWSR